MKKIIPLLLFVLSSGCTFYDYGVRQDNPQLVHSWFVEHSAKGKYEFCSKLNEEPEIVVKHPEFHPSTSRSFSYIKIRSSQPITIESIRFEHRDPKGNLLAVHDKDWADISTPKTFFWFHNYYQFEKYHKEITEIIVIEYCDGEKKKVLKYQLPLKYKLHYTTWDVMMSV